MTNGSDPINAITGEPVVNIEFEGLTKREYFAAMAMQGLADQYPIYDGEIGTSKRKAINDLAKDAVKAADALIEALNKESK